MVLQEQLYPFVFNAGLNSKIDTFELPANNLLQADNVRFQLDGAISKRNGTIGLSRNILGGGQLIAGVACQAFNNELLAFDGTFVYSYIEAAGAWQNRGLAISVINDQFKIESTRIAQQNNPDGTNLNGEELYVWEDDRTSPVAKGAGVRYSLIDSATGAFIVSDQFIYTLGTKPKVIAVPELNQFNIYYCASYNTLFLNTVQTDRPNILSSLTTIIQDGYGPSSDAGPTPFAYDACLYLNLPLVVYGSQNGISFYYNGVSTVVISGVMGVSCVAVTVDSLGVIWVSYVVAAGYTGSGTYVATISGAFTVNFNKLVDSTVATNLAILEDLSKGSLNLTYEIADTPNNDIQNTIVRFDGALLPQNKQLGVGLASKPFLYNNQIYVNTVWSSKNQSTYFTFCLTLGMKCISKMNPGVGGTYRTNGMMAQCDSFPDGYAPVHDFMFANQKKGSFVSTNNTSYSLLGVNASYLDFTNINAFNSTEAASELHIVGGITKIYDGVSVVEDNFHLYPEIGLDGYGTLVTLTSGGNLQTGQYQYVICYEWADIGNLIERGQPSIPLTVQATAGDAAVLVIPTLLITDKSNPRSPVNIAIFRNIIVDGVPSPTFYRVTPANQPLINNITVQTITFTDTTSDTELAGNEPLYTSEQVYNSAPPSSSLICPFLTRVFLSGTEDPNVIWTSQDRFELDNYNTTPIEWSPLMVQGINSTGGPITAIAEMSGSCIVFKENIIYAFNGSGPNANATSGTWNDATVISEDTGTLNPNSVIRVPASQTYSGGLMYQSANKGIYLLDIGQINHYIGAQVEQYNGYHITSAELLDDNNEVIFTTLEGTCLVYNYYFNRWTTWSYLPGVDSCIWQDKLVIIQDNGQVLVQTEGVWTDYSSDYQEYPGNKKPIIRNVQIPWLAFGGNIMNFQSCRYVILLGHYLSPHILNMSVMYNYDPAPKEPISINSNAMTNTFGGLPTWGASPTFGGGPFTPYQFQYNFNFPWGQAISLLISDSPLSPNDQGGIWSALAFQVGVFDQSTVRLPARNKFSNNQGR